MFSFLFPSAAQRNPCSCQHLGQWVRCELTPTSTPRSSRFLYPYQTLHEQRGCEWVRGVEEGFSQAVRLPPSPGCTSLGSGGHCSTA